MPEKARLDVLLLERLAQEGIVEQVNLTDRQIVGGAPVASMSALSAFDSVLPVFDALSFFDRVAVLAIVSSSAFRCRSVQRPT